MTIMPRNDTLLKTVLGVVLAHRVAFGQERVFLRVVALVVAEVWAFSTHRVTDLLRALGLVVEEPSAWYRLWGRGKRFEEEAIAAQLLAESYGALGERGLVVGAMDSTQVPRTGKQVAGAGWLKNPRNPPWKVGIHWAQRFLNGCVLLPLSAGFSRALPVRFLPAFTAKAVASEYPAQKEHEVGLHFMGWLREQLNRLGGAARPLLMLADGAFDKVALWTALPSNTILLVRTAKNRVLKALPPPYAGRGRRRKYGERAPKPQDYLTLTEGWLPFTLLVRGHDRPVKARVEGPFLRPSAPLTPLWLIVVRGQEWTRAETRRRREPCFYLVNAVQHDGQWQLPLPLDTLLTWAWQRWEVEVVHREVKTHAGLGDKQCFHARAAVTSVQWSAWCYALLMLAGHLTFGLPAPRPPATSWYRRQRRWTFPSLVNELRAQLSLAHDFSAVLSPSPKLWPEIEPTILRLCDDFRSQLRC